MRPTSKKMTSTEKVTQKWMQWLRLSKKERKAIKQYRKNKLKGINK